MRVLSCVLFLAALSCNGSDKEPDSGDSAVISTNTDADGDGVFVADGDCDDANPDVYPGADEVCDGVDNNCNGSIDEDAGEPWYPDDDGDGYGDEEAAAVTACEAPTGHVSDNTDCDDADDAFHPDAEESDCTDPSDYNCDGSVGYEDADADGWAACEDCDDANAAVSPDAAEVCNDIDDDCDGDTDDEDDSVDLSTGEQFFEDYDGDGFGNPEEAVTACTAPDEHVSDSTDCDDTDDAFHPDAEESDCTDPNDYNCDGSVGYADDDADGWAACEECDDADASVNPDAAEVCNGVDDDCDGDTDDDDAGLDTSTASTWYADADGDSYGDAGSDAVSCDAPSGYVADDTDCDDSRSAINPGATEVCDSADTDEDCSGYADDDDGGVDSAGKSTWYADADADGYGTSTYTWTSCDAPSGYTGTSGDCDDLSASVNPGAAEVCDSADTDEDCDGAADDDDSSVSSAGMTSWYADDDGDGYGDPDTSTATCDQPSGYTSSSTDCDDANAAVNPGAEEVCNSTDDDCDGTADDGAADASTWYADDDGDGYGDPDDATVACDQPSGYLSDSADCDDDDDDINPDGEEVCNSADDDCDGDTDEDDASDASTWYADADGDGYGDPDDVTVACEQPSGYVSDNTDCDDTDASANSGGGDSGSETFSYTGSVQTFTVPDCIDEITITAYGAEGKSATTTGSSPGQGGMAEGTLSVSSGDVLYVYVGGSNGYNGGGAGWSGSSQTCNGGGASDVRMGGTALSDRIIVAGGGGGVSGETSWGDGGDGGGGSCGSNYCGGGGGAGYPSATGGSGSGSGGSGGSSCHGGPGGGGGLSSGGGGATTTCYSGATAGTGSLGTGGAGSAASSGCCSGYGAAGGGGGYYGGGGVSGGCCGGGGAGGGSSWTGSLSTPAFSSGVQSGDGEVVISW